MAHPYHQQTSTTEITMTEDTADIADFVQQQAADALNGLRESHVSTVIATIMSQGRRNPDGSVTFPPHVEPAVKRAIMTGILTTFTVWNGDERLLRIVEIWVAHGDLDPQDWLYCQHVGAQLNTLLNAKVEGQS